MTYIKRHPVRHSKLIAQGNTEKFGKTNSRHKLFRCKKILIIVFPLNPAWIISWLSPTLHKAPRNLTQLLLIVCLASNDLPTLAIHIYYPTELFLPVKTWMLTTKFTYILVLPILNSCYICCDIIHLLMFPYKSPHQFLVITQNMSYRIINIYGTSAVHVYDTCICNVYLFYHLNSFSVCWV